MTTRAQRAASSDTCDSVQRAVMLIGQEHPQRRHVVTPGADA